MNRTALVVVVVTLTSSVAFAQVEQPKSPPATRVQHMEFEPDLIAGGVEAPSDEVISATRRPGFEKLIQIRESFREKIMQSGDEL